MMGNMLAKYIQKILILNRYYQKTNFYQFILGITLKTSILIGIILFIYLLIDYFVMDIGTMLQMLMIKLHPILIFSLFFASELFLGIIPPEIFIAWTSNTLHPWFHLFLLSTLSYLVGFLAYFLGKRLYLVSSVKKFTEDKI